MERRAVIQLGDKAADIRAGAGLEHRHADRASRAVSRGDMPQSLTAHAEFLRVGRQVVGFEIERRSAQDCRAVVRDRIRGAAQIVGAGRRGHEVADDQTDIAHRSPRGQHRAAGVQQFDIAFHITRKRLHRERHDLPGR